jgi:hypothetical protein
MQAKASHHTSKTLLFAQYKLIMLVHYCLIPYRTIVKMSHSGSALQINGEGGDEVSQLSSHRGKKRSAVWNHLKNYLLKGK